MSISNNESSASYRRRNAEQVNARARERYARNGDDLRAKAAIRRAKNRDKLREASRRFRERHPNAAKEYYKADPVKGLLSSARSRAKKTNKEFNLDREDIVIPEVCPVLGVPLTAGAVFGFRNNAATLDRIDNSKGYVKGNVAVISWRANRIKADATLEELRALVRYMANAK